MAKKSKYYVVWNGHRPGVYDSWDKCQRQIQGFPAAVYKSFATRQEAEKAFLSPSSNYIGKTEKKKVEELTAEELVAIGIPDPESISVDGAWSSSSGNIEYQGVYTKTKQVLFHVGPLPDGTNNIAEFLALVHALAYCKQNNIKLPIYSDSRNAIGWVRSKEVRTNHPKSARNVKLFQMMDRAINWLNENTYSNKILKWETKAWGENPADFGRK